MHQEDETELAHDEPQEPKKPAFTITTTRPLQKPGQNSTSTSTAHKEGHARRRNEQL